MYPCPNCNARTMAKNKNDLMDKTQDEYVCTREYEKKDKDGKKIKDAAGCGCKLIVPKRKPKPPKA